MGEQNSHIPDEEQDEELNETQDQDQEEFDRERAMNTIRHLRKYEKEAKVLRRKLKELEKTEETPTDGQPNEGRLVSRLSEVERASAQLEGRVAQAEVKADFMEKALKAGATDLRLAYLAAQADGLLGDYDDGEIGPHDLTTLKKNYPHLFQAPTRGSGDGGSGTRRTRSKGSSTDEMNTWIRRSTGRS